MALLRIIGGSFVQMSFMDGKVIIGSGLILIERNAVSSGHEIVVPAGGVPCTMYEYILLQC